MDPNQWVAVSAMASAAAALANAILVGVLVRSTGRYARSTADILEESRKARLAAEQQAAASQRNVEFLTKQLEEQFGLTGVWFKVR